MLHDFCAIKFISTALLVEARMVIARVNLVRLCDHVVVEAILLVDFEESQIRHLLNALEIEVSLNHGWLRHEQLKND